MEADIEGQQVGDNGPGDRVRTLLVVSPYYPPVLGAQSIRAHKLVAHLPPSWRIHVVTVDTWPRYSRDEELLRDVPGNVTIHRVSRFFGRERRLPRILQTPDRLAQWILPALVRGLRIVRRHPVDVLLSLSPPPTAHLVALGLRITTGLPWIADIGDPWLRNPYGLIDEGGVTGRLQVLLERMCMNRCDLAGFVTEELMAFYGERYPGVWDKAVVLPNPYDPRDFDAAARREPASGGPYVILHAGSLYGIRDPRPLVAALKRVLSSKSTPGLRLILMGEFALQDEDVASVLEEMRDVIRLQVPRNHRDAVAKMLEADLLLLLDPSPIVPSFNQPLKLAEYLATGKPILALAPEGPSRRLIEQLGAGVVVSHQDTGEIEKGLLESLDLIERSRTGRFRYDPPDELNIRTVARILRDRILDLSPRGRRETEAWRQGAGRHA
jgi:glycosyltransferase involved in cell wall biosynthesis